MSKKAKVLYLGRGEDSSVVDISGSKKWDSFWGHLARAKYDMCYAGFRRATGIKLKPGQVVELTLKVGKTVREGYGRK